MDYGGYGCAQLLQQIDLKKYRKNPKYLIGYSDVTVLQSYLLKNGLLLFTDKVLKHLLRAFLKLLMKEFLIF
jgi:muramoyltetrapeptide carboxypeptidase LdcA involved in peptidoglycan recycling